MLICPACGWPHDEVLVAGPTRCSFCGWAGASSDLLRASGELSDYPQIVERLKALSQSISTDIGPELARRIVHYGLIERDPTFTTLLATVTKNACNAAFKSILMDLFPEKGNVDGDGTATG